jgi:hypothetical protein
MAVVAVVALLPVVPVVALIVLIAVVGERTADGFAMVDGGGLRRRAQRPRRAHPQSVPKAKSQHVS